MNGQFYEQLGGVAGLFEQWGACERTVVACALARRVPWPGLRLLQRAVEAALRQHGGDARLERDANDDAHLAALLADDDEDEVSERLQQLLTLLPLLRTDNERCKEVYVGAAPALVRRALDARRGGGGGGAGELCRQLLSYLLVHPALTHHDQRTLTQWLRYLETQLSGAEGAWPRDPAPPAPPAPAANIWGACAFRRTIGKNVEFRGDEPYFDPLQESFSKNGRDVDISLDGEKLTFDAAVSQPKSQRSNSLTPPSTNFMHMSSSAENLSDEPFVQKPRSFSLSSEHSLSQLRPLAGFTTGSETRLDQLRGGCAPEHAAMAAVASWLKSLRLHKYVWLFTNISYEQMMAIDEDYLEKLGVTKGARHKLLLSIRKLHERPAQLAALAHELGGGAPPAAVGAALDQLRNLLLTPICPASPLPEAILRVLELASKCVLSGDGRVPPPAPDADAVDPMSLHCWLVEKALHHPSFSSPPIVEALKRLRHRLPPRQFFHHVSDMPPHRRPHYTRWRTSHYMSRPRRSWPAVPPAVPRGKSHSYPPYPPPPPPADDYSGLDALCLQMTEQAIN
ncbi:unnamed protein product [Plutella xylostella]|uniref:(diamondback moth) hypothetical protein n=1 Tax=Plutella xylostella TaxID=51655 RepID=A0A8S4G4U0_PLUXY|nr:unnamed protein product [Plutella xylostella]